MVIHTKVIRDETKALAGELNFNFTNPEYYYYHPELESPLEIYDRTAPWDTVKKMEPIDPITVDFRKERSDSIFLVSGVEMAGKAFQVGSNPEGKVFFSKVVPKEIQIPLLGIQTTSKTGGILFLQNVSTGDSGIHHTATLVSFKPAPATFSFSSFQKLLNQ